MRVGLVFLWAAVAAIVLFLAGVFGALILTDRISFGSAPDPVTTAPAIQPTTDTSYTILVLNASPDDANTDAAKNLILAAGWTDASVSTVIAEDRTFEQSAVYYVGEADHAAALGLADALGVTGVIQSDAYAQAGSEAGKELTVVLGSDFAPQG